MKLYFYTKTNCPLCDHAKVQLQMLQEDYAFTIEERDIYTKDEWLEVYQIRIPVIETERGDVLDEGEVSYGELSVRIQEF